jgi:predicted glycoside hydrolase/deacetylase ChbG (UPF0249 family)
MKLILNADDAGRSQAVNDEILGLMDRGLLTSASLVATGSAIEELARRSTAFPRCSFGVHLFLDEFRAVTDLSAYPAVVGKDGHFGGDARAYVYTNAFRRAIATEWIMQIERVRSFGVRVSHLDSHHHIHTFPPLFPVLKEVQRATGIRKVRLSMNCFSMPIPRALTFKKALFNWVLRHYVPTVTTSHFSSFGMFHSLLEGGRLPKIRSLELMVHPGAATYMKLSNPYEAEVLQMEDGWQHRLPVPWTLCSYNDLA